MLRCHFNVLPFVCNGSTETQSWRRKAEWEKTELREKKNVCLRCHHSSNKSFNHLEKIISLCHICRICLSAYAYCRPSLSCAPSILSHGRRMDTMCGGCSHRDVNERKIWQPQHAHGAQQKHRNDVKKCKQKNVERKCESWAGVHAHAFLPHDETESTNAYNFSIHLHSLN